MTTATKLGPLMAVAALTLSGCDGRSFREALPWQSFSMGSTFMEPTVRKGTFVTGVSVEHGDLAHGDLIVVRHGEQYWISRLAAKPGDTIALIGGTVVLNGKPIPQREVGTWSISDSPDTGPARLLAEHFPGERRAHRILDLGATLGDDFEEITLGRDEYFLLGDNRDQSADSRYDNALFGLGLVKGEDILRRVEVEQD